MLCDGAVVRAAENAEDAAEFWVKIGGKFPALGEIIPYLLCLPNSNAHTERLFSMMKAVHTPVRNSLSLETINSILSIKVNKKTGYTNMDKLIGNTVKKECKEATMVYNRAHCSGSK